MGADDGLERKTWDCVEDKFLPQAPESQKYRAVCGRERPLVVGQMRLFGREKTQRLCLLSEITLRGGQRSTQKLVLDFLMSSVFVKKINFSHSGSSLDRRCRQPGSPKVNVSVGGITAHFVLDGRR